MNGTNAIWLWTRPPVVTHIAGMSALSDQIMTDAAKLASSANDGVSTSRRPLGDLIAADKHVRAMAAQDSIAASPGKNRLPFTIMQVVAPGGG